MKYAQIHNGIVVNIIVWDGNSPYPSGNLVKIETYCGLGFRYINGEFLPPEEIQ